MAERYATRISAHDGEPDSPSTTIAARESTRTLFQRPAASAPPAAKQRLTLTPCGLVREAHVHADQALGDCHGSEYGQMLVAGPACR